MLATGALRWSVTVLSAIQSFLPYGGELSSYIGYPDYSFHLGFCITNLVGPYVWGLLSGGLCHTPVMLWSCKTHSNKLDLKHYTDAYHLLKCPTIKFICSLYLSILASTWRMSKIARLCIIYLFINLQQRTRLSLTVFRRLLKLNAHFSCSCLLIRALSVILILILFL